ncbi:uncharacterized protein LOC135153669 [Lytechinus pictus]|uniref:uncharacterized protein LOC135153669 n=1 Tax=Lytechinus pictus TaxID=7653 RepID=UPI0030B9F96B
MDNTKSEDIIAGIKENPTSHTATSCQTADNGKEHSILQDSLQESRHLCSIPSRQTLLGKLEHYLHKAAISRIALLPTVHASLQSTDSTKDGAIHDHIPRHDAASSVPITTEDTDAVSGWLRLKEAYFVNREDGLSRELYEVVMMFVLGGMLGFVYGGFPASRFARQRYIHNSQASLYHSRLEATVSTLKYSSQNTYQIL